MRYNCTRVSIKLSALALAAGLVFGQPAQAQQVTGAGAPYEPVTLVFEGPLSDERSGSNPFADMRLNWVVSNGETSWTVPGYFAGCGMAADNGCTTGNVWRAHFVPPQAGTYTWQIDFVSGTDIAISGLRGQPLAGHAARGEFAITGQSADPVRARGVLQYTGENYYRYSGDNSVFFKFGPDAPENMLAFAGFDETPNVKGLRKEWQPHIADFQAESSVHLWGKDGRGAGLLGMLDYLAGAGANSVSMLLWNTGGDDRNVFPHLLAVDHDEYTALAPAAQWTQGVVQDRFDVSKLDQWQRALGYADKLGLHLHLKLQETENDKFMEGGALGRTRKLYLREMVARFGHYLAVTWNLGEENVQLPGDMRHMASYVDALDAYDRPVVLHSYPDQKERYRPLLGPDSHLNGLSLQGRQDDMSDLRSDVTDWSMWAALAGKPMVMAYDEPGSAMGGAGVDPDYPDDRLPSPREVVIDPELFIRDGLWNALTAGANGVEAYYGYKTGCSDLDCQDHRTRARLWEEGKHALDFFRTHLGDKVLSMQAIDGATLRGDDYVFAQSEQTYVIVPGKEPVTMELLGFQGRYSVRWFDRARGGALQTGSVAQIEAGGRRVAIGDPPATGSGKWVALVERLSDEGILVEAEDFVNQRLDQVRSWCRAQDCLTGWERPRVEGYVALTPDTRQTHDDKLVVGENFSNEPGRMAVLSYDVDFPAAGRWYVWARIFATGSEDNGVHVGLNGTWPESGARIQYCPGRGRWYWDSRQRTVEDHCGVRGGIWLDVPEAGKHKVEFSMREDGLVMDAFYLTRSPFMPPELQEANDAEDRAVALPAPTAH